MNCVPKLGIIEAAFTDFECKTPGYTKEVSQFVAKIKFFVFMIY